MRYKVLSQIRDKTDVGAFFSRRTRSTGLYFCDKLQSTWHSVFKTIRPVQWQIDSAEICHARHTPNTTKIFFTDITLTVWSDGHCSYMLVYRDGTDYGSLQEIQAEFLRLYISVLRTSHWHRPRTVYSQLLSSDIVDSQAVSISLTIRWLIDIRQYDLCNLLAHHCWDFAQSKDTAQGHCNTDASNTDIVTTLSNSLLH